MADHFRDMEDPIHFDPPTYRTNHGRELVVQPEPEEVVDGEVDQPISGMRWETWEDPRREVRCFKLEVSEDWYRSVDRADFDRLNAALAAITELAKLTRGQRPRGGRW